MQYDLKPKPHLRIEDTYYDTHDRTLQKKMISLRVRNINGTLLVAMKSKPQRLAKNWVRRSELELPWSYHSVAKIAKASKLHIPTNTNGVSTLAPTKLLSKMELVMIQERRTEREARSIIHRGTSRKSPIGELDIDDVIFPGDTKVRIFEVEIEAKTSQAMNQVREIGEALGSMYPSFLKTWPHGKLATGMAIRKLLEMGVLQDYVYRGRLKPEAYPMIERAMLSNRSFTKS